MSRWIQRTDSFSPDNQFTTLSSEKILVWFQAISEQSQVRYSINANTCCFFCSNLHGSGVDCQNLWIGPVKTNGMTRFSGRRYPEGKMVWIYFTHKSFSHTFCRFSHATYLIYTYHCSKLQVSRRYTHVWSMRKLSRHKEYLHIYTCC
jgi:hypothetical protein